MALRHLISVDQLDTEVVSQLFGRIHEMRSVARHHASQLLSGYIMASYFYEPSTRTRFSHEAAMLRLGGNVIGTENAKEFSSAAKGETLEDSIRIVSGLADIIVLRHTEEGAAKRAASVSRVPIINGGDGPGEHPTQALIDLYTIYNELGTLENLTIAIVGDLKHGRTIHSLAKLLCHYKARLILVSPQNLQIPSRIKAELSRAGIEFEEVTDLTSAVPRADVIYMTRIQKERFTNLEEYERCRGCYVLRANMLEQAKSKMAILHPLPRIDEIHTDVDSDPRAAYFRQADNGLLVRMTLLAEMLRPTLNGR